ncbi:MAG: fibronectin type III domain-containing protein, partial [Candidatus Omnitrophica bacterium]|nr:fibronectin type III domain-containing protein [Candidatus Omnitrophota bacterium]
VGSNLDGLASGDRLTPLSDFTVSATNSPSEYILEYLGNIATTGSPSISATSATQNANATTVTISYTGTDPDNDTVTYTAVDCEYSLDSTDGINGTWNDMTTSETTESFTSDGASLSYVWNAASDTNVYDGIVYLRLTVKDGIGHASKAVSIAPIAVDTLAPSGLGNFNINGTATTMITVAWDTVTDDNWLNDAHYEIWYGIVQADVQTCSGTALKWDHAFDGGLANRAATTTTITNLAPETTYFFKIWAVDGFANEATVADITGDTNESPNENIYDIQIDPIYDSANDAILITTSLLMRSGSIVTDLTDITLTYVGVLNNAGILLSGNLNGAGDTVEGTTSAIFYTTWNPAAGLSADTAYTVISKISYNGENFSGVRTLTVDRLGSVTQDLLLVDHQTSGLLSSTSSVGAKISAFSASFDDHEDEQVTFRDTRQQELASIETEVGVIAEDTTADLTGFVEDEFADETAKGVQTEIITRGTTVVTGSTVTIRFRTVTGASPVVTVYDSKNVTRTINAAMTENGTTGIYAYNVDFKTTWGLGDFTVLVREPASGSVDSIVMSVVQSLTTGGGGETTSSSISTDLIYSRLSNMDGDITSLVEGMSDVNTVTADVSSDIELLLEKLGSAQLAGPMEAQTMTDILGAVGAV